MRTMVHPILVACVRDATVPDRDALAAFAAILAEDVECGSARAAADRPIMAWARCALEGSPKRR
ncbi:hypothetical protein [Sphingomonas qomolangmaensis]|uniref:Uncharacterized protein n=1 Tax=Sphingomonas qomolangmaensis TaxID=2918765 RepID=A0ABY5L7J4_9SPHN|nr:hypothetical protein [Sphingomonas qomolangmaensis]UUL82013.1 hypothetical protein NMP03_12575 [Sphingomonas qomolangmaensis]